MTTYTVDPTTRRAEEIREETGMAWELACQQAERERDDATEGTPDEPLTPQQLATLAIHERIARAMLRSDAPEDRKATARRNLDRFAAIRKAQS